VIADRTCIGQISRCRSHHRTYANDAFGTV
jgi:hypothetical protein